MYCKDCGAPLDEGALFCRRCGAAVADEPEQKQEAPVFSDAEPEQKEEASVFADLPPRKERPEKAPKAPKERKKPKVNVKLPKLPKLSELPKKNRLLLLIGAAALLLIVLTVVIVSVASCAKTERFDSPEALGKTVVEALERGDGGRLASLAKTSAPFLGTHPETYGEGDTPEAVMQGYYARTAEEFRAKLTERFGPGCSLKFTPETTLYAGVDVFEMNRALGLEAPQYAILSGPLSVGGETAANLRIVAAETDGGWKLIVLYLY